MAGDVEFFAPTDVFSIGDDWKVQTTEKSKTKERASGLGATGDEIAHKDHSEQDGLTCTYKCYVETGNLTLPKVGAISGGYHIDSINLAYSPTDWPTLTVTGHKHSPTSHTTGSCRTYTATPVFPAQFCIPSNVTSLSMTDASIGMRSLTYDLSCTHVDEDKCGGWLAGENHDGVETLAAEFTGVPDSLTIADGWTQTEKGDSSGNTAVTTSSVSITQHIAADDNGGGGGGE